MWLIRSRPLLLAAFFVAAMSFLIAAVTATWSSVSSYGNAASNARCHSVSGG